MIQSEMKRWRIWTMALILVALVAFGVRHVLEKRAQRKRQVEYEKTLRSYSEDLRTGMTRKDVEDYLSAKNVPFRHMCCANRRKFSYSVYDDLVKIGSEDAPWFCSEKNVYVALEFVGPERHSIGASAEPNDTLNTITIFNWLEGCM